MVWYIICWLRVLIRACIWYFVCVLLLFSFVDVLLLNLAILVCVPLESRNHLVSCFLGLRGLSLASIWYRVCVLLLFAFV